MAGIKVTKGNGLRPTMNKFTAGIGGTLRVQSQRTAIRAGIAAQQAMRHVIETTPSDISEGKPDRVDTGYMRDRVDHNTTFRHQRYEVKFGWLQSRKKYFLVQDQGGIAFGKFQVSGMFALRAGLRAAQRVLEEDIGKVSRKK